MCQRKNNVGNLCQVRIDIPKNQVQLVTLSRRRRGVESRTLAGPGSKTPE